MVDFSVTINDTKDGYHIDINSDATKAGVSGIETVTDIKNDYPGEELDYFYSAISGEAAVSGNIRLLTALYSQISGDSSVQAQLLKSFLLNSTCSGSADISALLTIIGYRSYSSAFSTAFK